MGWQDASTLRGEVKGWWHDVRGPLAMDVRARLIKGSLTLGAVAVIMARAANRLEDYIP